MRAVYRECKERRVPLGEHLVKSRRVTPERLRATLLSHTVESLRMLCEASAATDWNPGPHGGYSPRFTFGTAELLVRVFAEMHRPAATEADEQLAVVMGEGDWGAAFVRSGEQASPQPVSLFGAAPQQVRSLVRLGRWAASALDLLSVLHKADPFVASVLDDGSLVAWQSGGTIFAGRTSAQGPARMLNRRASVRRMAVGHGAV
jgi:hypothetical protein